jgi:hypothetical protein
MDDKATLLNQIKALLEVAKEQHGRIQHELDTDVVVGYDTFKNEIISASTLDDIVIGMYREEKKLGSFLEERIRCGFAIPLPLGGILDVELESFDDYAETLVTLKGIALNAISMYTKEADVMIVLQGVLVAIQEMVDLLIHPVRLIQRAGQKEQANLPKRETMDLIAALMTTVDVHNTANMTDGMELKVTKGPQARGVSYKTIRYSEAKLGWEQLGTK